MFQKSLAQSLTLNKSQSSSLAPKNLNGSVCGAARQDAFYESGINIYSPPRDKDKAAAVDHVLGAEIENNADLNNKFRALQKSLISNMQSKS